MEHVYTLKSADGGCCSENRKKRYNEKKRCTTLCRKPATRATGEEPALFRAALMYNDTTNAAGSTILSTDCGDPADPPWEYAMAQYLHEMEEHGVSRDALRSMTQTLPAQLLGLEDAAE